MITSGQIFESVGLKALTAACSSFESYLNFIE
jgi:hypothetical protein